MYTFIPEDMTWAIMQEREAAARAALATAVPRTRRRPSSVRGALARRLVGVALWLNNGVDEGVRPAHGRHCSRIA